MTKILNKIYFRSNEFDLHNAINWIMTKDQYNGFKEFDYNNDYYIFKYIDDNDIQYNCYSKNMVYINDSIFIEYLISPDLLFRTI